MVVRCLHAALTAAGWTQGVGVGRQRAMQQLQQRLGVVVLLPGHVELSAAAGVCMAGPGRPDGAAMQVQVLVRCYPWQGMPAVGRGGLGSRLAAAGRCAAHFGAASRSPGFAAQCMRKSINCWIRYAVWGLDHYQQPSAFADAVCSAGSVQRS